MIGKNYYIKFLMNTLKLKTMFTFIKRHRTLSRGSGRYSFYATRYDYLRIAKTIMEDWNNNTCAGKYLKTIYERRINKNKKVMTVIDLVNLM